MKKLKDVGDRNDKCRVCTQLKVEGKTGGGLFENLLSIYLTGCPLFADMQTSQRRSMAIKLKICFQLLWVLSHKLNCRVERSKVKNYICTACRGLTRLESANKSFSTSHENQWENPMFLFFHVKEKNKGANMFFDEGCSTACF